MTALKSDMGLAAKNLLPDLLYDQQKLAADLQQLLSNTTKLGIDKRTHQKYADTWERTKVIWNVYLNNHEKIESTFPSKQIAYFSEGKFELTHKIVLEIQGLIHRMEPSINVDIAEYRPRPIIESNVQINPPNDIQQPDEQNVASGGGSFPPPQEQENLNRTFSDKQFPIREEPGDANPNMGAKSSHESTGAVPKNQNKDWSTLVEEDEEEDRLRGASGGGNIHREYNPTDEPRHHQDANNEYRPMNQTLVGRDIYGKKINKDTPRNPSRDSDEFQRRGFESNNEMHTNYDQVRYDRRPFFPTRDKNQGQRNEPNTQHNPRYNGHPTSDRRYISSSESNSGNDFPNKQMRRGNTEHVRDSQQENNGSSYNDHHQYEDQQQRGGDFNGRSTPPVYHQANRTENPNGQRHESGQNSFNPEQNPRNNQPPPGSEWFGGFLREMANVMKTNNNSRGNNLAQDIRVPRMEVPFFNGDTKSFRSFENNWNTFVEPAAIGKLEKFSFLKSRLTGKAELLLRPLMMSERNYDEAWRKLKKEFDNERENFDDEWETLIKLQRIRENRPEDLVSLKECITNVFSAIENMGLDPYEGPPFAASTIIDKFDQYTRTKFDRQLQFPRKCVPLETVINFIDRRIEESWAKVKKGSQGGTHNQRDCSEERSRDRRDRSRSRERYTERHQSPRPPRNGSANIHVTFDDSKPKEEQKREIKCFICADSHKTADCQKLLNAANKLEILRHFKVCIICLCHKFNVKNKCRKQEFLSCDVCKGKHATIMCGVDLRTLSEIRKTNEQKEIVFVPIQSEVKPTAVNVNNVTVSETVMAITQRGMDQKTNLMTNETGLSVSGTLLPTVTAEVIGANDNPVLVRMFMDQGSQVCCISEALVKELKLKKRKVQINLKGVGGQAVGTTKSMVTVKIKTRDPETQFITFKALVLPKIASQMPPEYHNIDWTLDNRDWSDRKFNVPAHVPLLLGANVLPHLFMEGTERVGNYLLQNTKLGWTVSGGASRQQDTTGKPRINTITMESEPDQVHYLDHKEFEAKLIRFWDMAIEHEIQNKSETEYCEKLFLEKHARTKEGRYMCPIPWNPDKKEEIGASFGQALGFYKRQEAQWQSNLNHKEMSQNFMKDYIEKGHMVEVPLVNTQSENQEKICYIPYFSIFRQDSLSTKCRNVFHCASKTSTGQSINDLMLPGESLLNHIPDILNRIRQFPYIYTADIKQMFRQIELLPEDAAKMRILWRERPEDQLRAFALKTVTYGTVAAPWQAMRCLHQTAKDNTDDEKARWIIKKSFFMDDLVHGAFSIEEAQHDLAEIDNALGKGCFPLTKFATNNETILKDIAPDRRLSAFSENPGSFNILGITYNAIDDTFTTRFKVPENLTFTKAGMLSLQATIYDSNGYFTPVVMAIRALVQGLWKLKLDWNDPIPEESKKKFMEFIKYLHRLAEVRIPRYLHTTTGCTLNLVGFCDASQIGYGAVIYSRTKVNETWIIRLLTSKGHVTPLKHTLNDASGLCTIPKLELESILLMTELIRDVKSLYKEMDVTVQGYTDSMIAMDQIRNTKDMTTAFVKRRVLKIRKVLKPHEINHCPGKENPADLISRGCLTEDFVINPLWKEGPHWMTDEVLPKTELKKKDKEDEGSDELLLSFTQSEAGNNGRKNFLDKSSSFKRQIAGVALLLNWAKRDGKPAGGALTCKTIMKAKHAILKYQQRFSFGEEINKISKKRNPSKKHFLATLDPWIDEKTGLLRVGGRLSRSSLPEERKNPVILPKCHLTDNIIRETHTDHGHAGNTLVEKLVTDQYWIPGLRQRVTKVLKGCTTCNREKKKTYQPKQSDLPLIRMEPSPTFQTTGVDCAGPFHVKMGLRGKTESTVSMYVALFVCMSTKLIHIEVLSDLTTDTFLAGFTRFTSRRGCPAVMMSDNGPNFIGSNRALEEAWSKLKNEAKILLGRKQIIWKHIPPRSPEMGGIWESNIKMMKIFLKKINYPGVNWKLEEFMTACCRVESYLNCRPLTPLSSEPDCLEVLTPGHFAIQRSLVGVPTGLGCTSKLPVTKRWFALQNMQEDLWKQHQHEYLNLLQKRYKCQNPTRNAQVNDLVIIEEPNTPSMVWKRGRIIRTYPDEKGTVRKVDVQLPGKQVAHRAVNRLVPLLPEEEIKIQTSKPKKTPKEIIKEDQTLPNAAETTSKQDEDSESEDNKSGGEEELIKEKGTPKGKLFDTPDEDRKDMAKEQDSDEEPKPLKEAEKKPPARRSPRLQAKKPFANSVAVALMCLCATAFGIEITPLEPGLHVFKIGTVERQMTTIEFAVRTKANLTEDFGTLEEQSTEFTTLCDKSINEKLIPHCKHLGRLLQREIRSAKDSILERYDENYESVPRSKRSWYKLAWKGASKYGTELLVAASLLTLEVQQQHTERQIDEMKNKVVKISTLVLNVTDTEYEAVENQMEQLLTHQKNLFAQIEMTDYATAIQTLLASTVQKHEQLHKILPLEELRGFVDELNQNGTRFEIPQTIKTKEIFNTYPTKQKLENGRATITFTIPIMFPVLYKMFLIVSVPDNNDEYLLLKEGHWQVLAMDPDNGTYFDIPLQEYNPSKTMFEIKTLKATPNCATEAIRNEERQSCTKTKQKRNGEQVFLLREGLVLIKTDKQSRVTITCSEKKQQLEEGYFQINFPNCSLTGLNFQLDARNPTTIQKEEEEDEGLNLRPPPMELELVRPSEQLIKDLRREITDEVSQLSAMKTGTWADVNWLMIALGATLAVIAAAALITIIIICKKKDPTQILKKKDLQMGAWMKPSKRPGWKRQHASTNN